MINAELYIINTPELFHRFKTYVENLNPEYIVVDTETDSKIEKTAKLYGIGLCFNDNKAFYIPWKTKNGNAVWQWEDEQFIKTYLSLLIKDLKVIGHNILYDCLVIENNWGLDISSYIYSDTILLKHTIDEEIPHGLKETAARYLGDWATKAQDKLYENIEANGGKTTKEQVDMYKADTEILAEYCMWDVLLTYKLFKLFDKRLKEENLDKLYEEEIMPLYREVTINMKRKGFPIDLEHFINLDKEITKDINRLEDEIIAEIDDYVFGFTKRLLDEKCPISTAGTYPKVLAELLEIPLPVTKEGKVTLAKKALESQRNATPEFSDFYSWLLGENDKFIKLSQVKTEKLLQKAQIKMFNEKYPEQRYVFNLKSNDHLAFLLVTALKYRPLEKTPTGKAKIDDDFLESLKDYDPVVKKLIDFKKLNKLKSTYIEGILERQIDSVIYASMLQFGTTSGRYSSRDPNLQNLPRIKDDDTGLSEVVLYYTNAIKQGFVAPKGYSIVNADYSSLEPVCFAHVSNENKLRNVFKNGEDLYSRIAIDVFKLDNVSAHKKDPNYLKNIQPEYRQLAKVFCLAVVYGAEAGRIKDIMKCSYAQAAKIIQDYLQAYPELKNYMENCDKQAKTEGFVKTEFGRIRHLLGAKTAFSLMGDQLLEYKWASDRDLLDKRSNYKNLLNNAKNFKIQGLAAHIVNRAMIALTRRFKADNIEAWIVCQVHDEITVIAKEEQAELVKKIMKEVLENTTIISVPLQADPIIGKNWAEAK